MCRSLNKTDFAVGTIIPPLRNIPKVGSVHAITHIVFVSKQCIDHIQGAHLSTDTVWIIAESEVMLRGGILKYVWVVLGIGV